MNHVIIGDLNARIGSNVMSLFDSDSSISYNPIDQGVNDNGSRLLCVCRDQNLLPVNNLLTNSTSFSGSLTYRHFSNFKLNFYAVKSKFGLLIELSKTNLYLRNLDGLV